VAAVVVPLGALCAAHGLWRARQLRGFLTRVASGTEPGFRLVAAQPDDPPLSDALVSWSGPSAKVVLVRVHQERTAYRDLERLEPLANVSVEALGPLLVVGAEGDVSELG